MALREKEMNRTTKIRVVLVSPLYGGNVGSVCRAMANTGFSELAIASPRSMDLKEARMMACGGRDILEQRREYPSLAQAVADCGTVVGATARVGLYRSHSRTPRESAARVLDATRGAPVALVFGREDNGLSNEELALCTDVIQIPSTTECPSLNLAQAVMICLYEIFVVSDAFEPTREKSGLASSDLRERMFTMWRDMLMDIGFMKEDKADHMMMGLRRIFSRGAVTEDDMRILMGVARQARWHARQQEHEAFQDAGRASS